MHTGQFTEGTRNIKLQQELHLPEGLLVELDIKPKSLSLDEKRQLTDELRGAWKDDASVEPIFKEIEQNRSAAVSREVDTIS